MKVPISPRCRKPSPWIPQSETNGGQSSDSTKTPRAGYGSLAVGALAIGALAVGALAVGALEIRKARLREVEIDDLVVHRFRVVEEPGEESV